MAKLLWFDEKVPITWNYCGDCEIVMKYESNQSSDKLCAHLTLTELIKWFVKYVGCLIDRFILQWKKILIWVWEIDNMSRNYLWNYWLGNHRTPNKTRYLYIWEVVKSVSDKLDSDCRVDEGEKWLLV